MHNGTALLDVREFPVIHYQPKQNQHEYNILSANHQLSEAFS